MAHELRKITIDNHVTFPLDVTMTLVLIEDLYDDTSALHSQIAASVYMYSGNKQWWPPRLGRNDKGLSPACTF